MNINKVRRIVKAQLGLTTSSFFPSQNLTYWDSNLGLIAFNNANLLWQNNTTTSLLGNPYMRSTGIPTAGKPNTPAELAAIPGMQKLLQLYQDKLTEVLNVVAALKNPEKAASLIATGKAQVVDGQFLKKPLLSKELLGKIGGFINQGIDFASNFILPDYSGKYGSTALGVKLLYNKAANYDSSGALKAIGFASDLLTMTGGDLFKTDNETAVDGVLSAIPILGLLNALGGKRTQDFSADNYTIAQVGGSYGGSVHDINNAVDKANKKYGLLSGGARRKANRQINDARRLQNLMADIANDASDRFALASDLNHIQYGFDINGGYDLRYMRAAKLGGILKRVKRINFHKVGGEIKEVIDLNKEWTPEIINPIELFEEGGNIEWKPTIILLEGGNITNKLAILDLFKDYDLSNINIIDSLSPRVEGNNIYASTDEDLIHELHHYTSQNKPNELYKDFYSDLNDDKITKLGGNLEFVSRTGDPSDFYAPAELEARLRAAKYKSSGLNYTKDFFKLLRTDENKYGYNMRDLLYMFNDENLEKLFNLKKSESFKEGGKTYDFKDAPLYKEYELRLKGDSKTEETTLKNIIPEGALHARKHNMENADSLTKKGIPVVDDEGVQQAEIECNELILTLEITKKLEELYNDGSDEAAIEAGKLLVYEILENTDDRTGLITKCKNGGVIDGTK